MDLIKDLGSFTFGSRLRRLTERVMQEVAEIYKLENIEFGPRHCSILLMLLKQDCATTADLATLVGISTPAVSQLVAEMTRAELVEPVPCNQDKRKKWLKLTPKGKYLGDSLQPHWSLIQQTVDNWLAETGTDVLKVFDQMEEALDRKSLKQRFKELK